MIICPECGKEIADDSAHCGYCGAQISSGAGKKTMLGMAPVTADMMAQAAAEAKAAREAAQDAADTEPKSLGDLKSEGKLKIPKPSGAPAPASSSGSSLPSPGKLSIPKIGEPTPMEKEPVQAGYGDELSDAKTSALPSVDEEPPGNAGAFAPSTVEEVAAPSEPPSSFASANEGFKMNATDPPVRGPARATNEPAWAGGAADGVGPQGLDGDGPIVVSGNTLPEKKQNKLIFVFIGVAVMTVMCCIGAAVVFGLSGM